MNQDLVIGPFLYIQCFYFGGVPLVVFLSLISFLRHGRQAWNKYSKWGRMSVPYNLSKNTAMVFIDDAFMALIIEVALFAPFAHWR